MNNNEPGNSGWIDKNLTAYKISISVIFGLLGFSINFLTISFSFPPYTATVLIGLLFPMLITLSWGWKYGLLSALAGGCQSVWWLWSPSNGYAVFFVVPPFTLWIVWHGLFAELRKKRKDHQWWLNTYAIEVPFRILSTINLYTLARWAITLNPPPWSWASGAPDTIPIHFSHFVVIKQFVVGYIILLLADVLLNFGFIRKLFGLKEKTSQAYTSYIISVSLLLGAFFWIIDSILGSSVFYKESSFLDLLALGAPHYALYVRSFFILACLTGGLLASRLLRKQRESDIALKESEKRLSHAVDGNAIPTFMIDRNHTITHWNKACENLTGVSAGEMVGTKNQWSAFYSKERPVLADFILDKLSEEEIAGYYNGKTRKSTFTEGAYNAENFFPDLGKNGKWLFFTAAPLRDQLGEVIGAIETLLDITERKRAEKALRESEEKYRSIFENAVEGFFQSTPEGRFISVNPAFAEMLGYASPEELISNISDIAEQYYVNPEDRLRYKQLLQKDGSVEHFEFRVRCKDGSKIWVSNSTRAIYDPGGKIARYEGNIKNITLRKQALQSLRESEEKHRLLAENTVDCIWQMNLDLEFTYINQAIFPLLGYTTKEWIGSKLSEHCSSKEMEKMQAIIADVFANLPGKTTEVFETSFYHKNGKEIPCELSGKIILDDAGNPIYFQGSARDITERKNAIKILQDSEKKLAQVIQGNLIPTFVIDNNHIITHWNKSCENLTGISAAEMAGTKKHWLAFYDEERPVLADFIVDGATDEEIDGYYHDGKHNKSTLIEGAYEGEKFYPNLGEKGKWLFFTAAPLRDYDGNIIGAIETFQDITEYKKLEAQLLQVQKMEAIGSLAGGIAHDFNNILSTIIGNAHIALMDVIKDESLRRGIEEIKKAGERAASLTRQLLAFSRKQVIKPEVLDLNEVMNETEKMLKRLIGEDIEFQTVLEPELWKVHMDPGQIDQIIINMVVNSRDAMPQGGKLVVETANVNIDEKYFREHGIKETPGSYVMLAISDTGSGMNKETREHIFEPFFTTKEIGKGTGLGLSTVYGIAKQNNGFIWVYSEPGQGTTFKIYLPGVKRDVKAEEKERTCVEDPGGSETVLIVEDDDSLRKLAQKALQRHGYRTLAAENGEEALRVSKEYDGLIDLVVTDVVMPKMSGREVAEMLQSLRPEIKVIYMSGYTDNAIVHHGVLAPGLNFLEKPFSPEGLARKVREVLDRGD